MPDTAPLARGRRPAAGPQTDRRRSFLKHTPGVGSGYPATVRRSSDESVVVLLGDTGIEATISKADMKLFFTGVGQFIPQPGTTISEVTVVRIENPGDPKRRHPFVRVTLL